MEEEANFQTLMCGKKVLVPYLIDKKTKSIDYLIISHFDTDHVRTDF